MLAALCGLAAAGPIVLTNCAGPDAHSHGVVLQANPNPFVCSGRCPIACCMFTKTAWPFQNKGDNVTISGTGTLEKLVTGGKFNIKATYLGIQVLDVDKDVCSDAVIDLPLGVVRSPLL